MHRARRERPRSFLFFLSLQDLGRIRRLLLRHGFEVSLPRHMRRHEWRIQAIAPETLSRDRLRRLANLIDRTPSMAVFVKINVRVFTWLGMDRRQPVAFYKRRRALY